MTDTSSLSDLIERLEKATGPDRELDLAIQIALEPDGKIAHVTLEYPRGLNHQEGYAWDIYRKSVVYEKWTVDGRCPVNGGYPLPEYTSSIDAAMTLVPEGWSRHLSEDDKNIWWVELRHGHATSYDNVTLARNQSIAIALCIAVLKAQLSTRTNEQDDARNLSGVSSE